MNNELPKPITKEQETSWQKNDWQPRHGWLEIVPGLSLLEQAIAKFGQPDMSWKIFNATCYSFAKKTIELTILNSDKEPIITHMRVLNDCTYKNAVPNALADAKRIFGPLEQTRIDESSTITFERPGVRVVCELFSEDAKIKWIEFYPPK